jgi:NAD(P)-dependent dehydrogenase (short-subunit alcohol dehydrogenase family)
MRDSNSTARRTALVTGASYGIGAATALALAQDGFDVAVSATRIENLSDVIAKLEAVTKGIVPVALNLRSHSSIKEVVASVIDALGHLDVLVNNAAIPFRKPAIEVTPDEWEAVMQTNLAGAYFMSQQMGRHLIESGRTGCIVNMASTHGVVGLAQRSVYGIAKAGVIHMTKMLAIEWAAHGIRVNAVAPGTVMTPSRTTLLNDPSAREMMLNRIPLRRFATVEEVAGAVRYLVSPEAAYVTGQTLLLDGGLTSY